MSSDEGSKEVLEDSKDKPAMKTRVYDFDEDSNGGEQEAKAMGMCLLSLANILFLFFLSFLSATS